MPNEHMIPSKAKSPGDGALSGRRLFVGGEGLLEILVEAMRERKLGRYGGLSI